jgi:hypothetical protein
LSNQRLLKETFNCKDITNSSVFLLLNYCLQYFNNYGQCASSILLDSCHYHLFGYYSKKENYVLVHRSCSSIKNIYFALYVIRTIVSGIITRENDFFFNFQNQSKNNIDLVHFFFRQLVAGMLIVLLAACNH